MQDLFDLSGKIAFITGATKGIGRATANAFADHGATIAITGRKEADAFAAAAEINQRAGRKAAIGLAADLLDPASLISAYDAAITRFGRVDVLICNAAAVPESYGRYADYPLAGWSHLLEANVVNNLALINHAVPAMKARKDGVILATTSAAGIYPGAMTLPYGVSKAGLGFMVRGLGAALAIHNVRVNAVAPGLTRTSSLEETAREHPEAVEYFKSNVPLRRIIEPEEIAAGMVFLASAGGRAITGQTIVMDGGEPGGKMDGEA